MAEATMTPEMLQSIKDQVFTDGNGGVNNPYAPPPIATPAIEEPPVSVVPANNAFPVIDPSNPETPPIVPAVDYNIYLKEKFGFDSEEIAKAEIERLRNAPPVIQPFEFPDEISKKLAYNIKEGRIDEVFNFIQGQRLLKDVDTRTPEEQLKLFIQMQNPRFDKADVEEEFSDIYSLDEENIAPEKLGRERKKMEQRKEDDLTKARSYFEQYKSKINLPDIIAPAPPVDEGYESFQKIIEQELAKDKVLAERLSKVTEADASYNYKFADEKSKIAFDISYAPTKEEFEKAKGAMQDWPAFLRDNYYSEDGSPLTGKFLKHQAIMQDIDGYTVEISKQAINATIKWFLANQKNVKDTAERNYAAVVPTEIDKLREQVYGK